MENELLTSINLTPIFKRCDQKNVKVPGETNVDCFRSMNNDAMSMELAKLISEYVGESEFISIRQIREWLDGPPTILKGPIMNFKNEGMIKNEKRINSAHDNWMCRNNFICRIQK